MEKSQPVLTNPAPNNATRRYAIFGVLFGLLFPIAATIVRMLTTQLSFTLPNMLHVQSTDPLLWIVDTAPIVLGFFAAYAGRKQDLLSKINEEQREHERELESYQLNLEQQMEQRTAELVTANQRNERRSIQFEAIARIAHTISSTQTLDELLPQISELISEQFGFYHVGIFLLDARREYAVLVAANSQGGKRMLARDHRLRVGEKGIVGFVAKAGQPRVALDTGLDAVFFNNPDLPDTHSEIALPLRAGTEVIGALDVQSTVVNAFTQEDVNILSTLANQVSVAIQNARSHQKSLEALSQADTIVGLMSEQQWRQFLNRRPIQGVHFDGVQAKLMDPSDNKRKHDLAIPLKLRGTQIGTLKLSASSPDHRWTDDEIAMAQATADRTAIAIENARLLQEAQKRASKEQTIGQISAKIGSLVSLENIIKTTLQELGSTLPDTDIAIQFTPGTSEQK